MGGAGRGHCDGIAGDRAGRHDNRGIARPPALRPATRWKPAVGFSGRERHLEFGMCGVRRDGLLRYIQRLGLRVEPGWSAGVGLYRRHRSRFRCAAAVGRPPPGPDQFYCSAGAVGNCRSGRGELAAVSARRPAHRAGESVAGMGLAAARGRTGRRRKPFSCGGLHADQSHDHAPRIVFRHEPRRGGERNEFNHLDRAACRRSSGQFPGRGQRRKYSLVANSRHAGGPAAQGRDCAGAVGGMAV